MARTRYPSDEKRTRPHVRVHLTTRTHPRVAHVWADPFLRGVVLGLWQVAREAYAHATQDTLVLDRTSVAWVTGKHRPDAARAVIERACAAMGYTLSERGALLVVHVRNFARKQRLERNAHPSELDSAPPPGRSARSRVRSSAEPTRADARESSRKRSEVAATPPQRPPNVRRTSARRSADVEAVAAENVCDSAGGTPRALRGSGSGRGIEEEDMSDAPGGASPAGVGSQPAGPPAPEPEAGTGENRSGRTNAHERHPSGGPPHDPASTAQGRARGAGRLPSTDAVSLARELRASVLRVQPTARVPADTDAALLPWARELDRMLRVDGRPVEQVRKAIAWVHGPNLTSEASFVVLSPAALRAKFDRMAAQAARERRRARAGANGSSAYTRDRTGRLVPRLGGPELPQEPRTREPDPSEGPMVAIGRVAAAMRAKLGPREPEPTEDAGT